MRPALYPAGVCRICGCTEGNACKLATGDPCMWLTRARDLCNRPQCILAAEQQKDADAVRRAQVRRETVQPITEAWRREIVERRESRSARRRRNRSNRRRSEAA